MSALCRSGAGRPRLISCSHRGAVARLASPGRCALAERRGALKASARRCWQGALIVPPPDRLRAGGAPLSVDQQMSGRRHAGRLDRRRMRPSNRHADASTADEGSLFERARTFFTAMSSGPRLENASRARQQVGATLLDLIQAAVSAPLLFLLWLYRRFVSPALPPSCRYYPSCSQYAEQAMRLHGPLRGTWLAARRLLRCHPFCEGGLDPVPPHTPHPRSV